ncbi:Ankrd17 [Symbiodinium microadriaticum]|nr:Ankrd17 [Symbiodinium microadriaticum]
MLRVFACVSGQELLAVSTEELGDVKTLKSRLRELHGFPLCLQRLVKDGQVLDDSLQLEDFAASTGNVDVAQFLLNAGVCEMDTDTEMPAITVSLIRAAECGHTAVAMLLLDGADRDAKHEALVAACKNGHAETAQRLLEAINCEESDPSEMYFMSEAFLCAVHRGHLEAMQVLLEGRADLADHCDAGLLGASSHGHGEVVKLLLGRGACKDVLGQSGLTGLMSAAANGHPAVVRVLVDVGADTSVQDSYGCTALLLASGASKTVKLSNGRAVLVTNPGHTESVRLLLEAGADKDKRDGQGRTALIEASLGNHAEIAQLLLEARADVHALDNFGRTALHCASSCGHMAIVDSLLEAGGTAEKNSGRADCQDWLASSLPSPTGLPVVAFAEEVETMRRLLSASGRTARHYRSEKTRRCLELLELGGYEENGSELCKNCKAFFSCRQSENATRLVRATLTSCRSFTEELALQPCWALRILDLSSFRCLEPRTLKILVSTFPKLRVLRIQPDEGYAELPSSAEVEGAFWPTLQGLEAQFATPVPPAWLCELRGLRRLHISATDRGAMIALPPCLGNLTELIHLNVVRNNLRGVSSLPSSLRFLSELRSFEAFENGATGETRDEHCPDIQVPQRKLCVPGYVARSEGERPNWRCPQAGWNIRLEDRSLPWWHWRKIEKMHIDANFIFGNIPDDIPDLWPRLRSLDLHDLQLTGPLPRSLGRLENLTQLQVQLNDLECGAGEEAVVAELLRHPKMRTLNVDANPRLCGCVPSRTRVDLRAQVGETQIKVGCSEREEL